jgi:hypothetical protein
MVAGLYLGFTHALQRPPDDFVPLGASVTPNAFFSIYALSISAALLILPPAGRAFLQTRSAKPLWVIVIIGCCVILHWRFGLHLMTGIGDVDVVVMNPQTRADLKAQSPTIEWLRRIPDAARTVGFNDVFFPGYDGISGVESITGSDPLENSYYRDLLATGGVPFQWMWRWVVDKESWDRMLPFYNLLNVRYFLATANRPDLHLQNLVKAADFDLSVYQNNSAWPRAFFVEKAVVYDSTAQFVAIAKDNRSGPFAAIPRSELQPQFPVLSADQTLDRFVAVPARDYKFTSNTTTFTIDAPRPGIAVLTETFLPDDFVLRVNGAPGRYFRVNHAFKGVLIPKAGSYILSFSYWPRRFNLALGMAAIGALLAAGWTLAILGRNPIFARTIDSTSTAARSREDTRGAHSP